jgi:endonuclease/exonuclease/phosphatase family metal-dependent hydrolase
MKMLTLNTWGESGPWKERWEVILKGLDVHAPDVVAFQELFNTDWCKEFSKRASYPFAVFPGSSSSGLVFLSRLPIQENRLYTMKRKSPYETYGRYALWAMLKWGNRPVHFFNTHLSWKLEDQATRRAQAEELCKWIKTKVEGGEVVLMGDMNATPDSEEITWFLNESGLVDAYGYLHPNETGFSWDNRNRFAGSHTPSLPDRRIDFIFVKGERLVESLAECRLVFTECDPRGIFASDHFGVLAEFAESLEVKSAA